MATTKEEIREWLNRGIKQGATHCIVVCDTFEYEDYPVFVEPTENCKEIADKYDGKEMQKIMEVYNLKMDLDTQLNERRAFNY